MSGKVKQNLLPEEKSPLQLAGEANDKFVFTLGDVVTRQLAGILKNDDLDPVARVSAGKALLEWIRPKRAGVAVQINTGPQYTSHLNLPQPEKPAIDVEVIEEVPSEYPRVLPEPGTPMQAGKLQTAPTAFEALRDLQADTFDRPEALVPRSPTTRTPDQPPSASNVKQFR